MAGWRPQIPRAILHWDENPDAIAFAQTGSGKAVFFFLFAILLEKVNPFLWQPIVLSAAGCSLAGKYRQVVFLVATVLAIGLNSLAFDGGVTALSAAKEGLGGQIEIRRVSWGALGAVFIFSACLLYGVRCFPRAPLLRTPVVSLLGLLGALVVLADSGLFHGLTQLLLWSFLGTFATFFWFLALAALDQKRSSGGSIPAQLSMFHPFWGSTTVPFGKSASYLRTVEAKTPHELAATQVRGLRLMAWCFLQKLAFLLMLAMHERLRIPTFAEALDQQVTGMPYGTAMCWLSLVSAFFEAVLKLSFVGNTMVASARMAGFSLLRNTYRPLQARTLAEFWNRYYWYFKELMVHCFFYPTFLRCFSSHPRLRVAFATFMSVGVGNFLFHLMRGVRLVAASGLTTHIVAMQTYAFYCIVLTTGITLSQLRSQRGPVRTSSTPRRFFSSVVVAGFYCTVLVFDDIDGRFRLIDHFGFFMHLFGLQ